MSLDPSKGSIGTPSSLSGASELVMSRLQTIHRVYLAPKSYASTKTYLIYQSGAHDKVVLQYWQRKNEAVHSFSVFHGDGDDLMYRHFSPWGNQPLLKLFSYDGRTAKLRLESVSGDVSQPFMKELAITFFDDGSHGIDYIYVHAGEEQPHHLDIYSAADQVVFD